MDIKETLYKIIGRTNSVFKKEIDQNFSEEYAKGFEHAVKLFRVAVVKEFGSYIQIEENKSVEIRALKKTIEQSSLTLSNRDRHIVNLEGLLIKNNSYRLSNTKKRKIYHAIVEITGQTFESVKERFLEIVERKGGVSV